MKTPKAVLSRNLVLERLSGRLSCCIRPPASGPCAGSFTAHHSHRSGEARLGCIGRFGSTYTTQCGERIEKLLEGEATEVSVQAQLLAERTASSTQRQIPPMDIHGLAGQERRFCFFVGKGCCAMSCLLAWRKVPTAPSGSFAVLRLMANHHCCKKWRRLATQPTE